MWSANREAVPAKYSPMKLRKSMSSNVPSKSSNNALTKFIPPASPFGPGFCFVDGQSCPFCGLRIRAHIPLRIESTGPPLAQGMDRSYRGDEGETGKDAHPPCEFHVTPPRRDHAAPRRRRGRYA